MNYRKILIFTLIAVVAVIVTTVYFLYDPSADGWFPKCPIYSFTGYKCPGCGTQRAIHALLGGDLAQAWHYNAGLLVALPVMALYVLVEIAPKRLMCIDKVINSQWFILVVLACAVAWTVLRNVMGW